MSTEATILLTGPDVSTQKKLDSTLYLLFIDNQIEFSQSDGPVKLVNDDGIISVKIQDDVDEATFSGHPLRKGAIYFLEDDDSIDFGGFQLKLVTTEAEATVDAGTDTDVDLFELHATNKRDESKEEPIEEVVENDDLILEVEQIVSDSDEAKAPAPKAQNQELEELNVEAPTDPKIELEAVAAKEDVTHGEFQLDTGEVTRTSIAVHELLQTHNEDNNNIPLEAKQAQREELKKIRQKKKAKKKKKRKTQSDRDLDLDGASRFKVTDKKQGTKKQARDESRFFVPSDNSVGPIVRILGTLSSIAIAIFTGKYIDLSPLAPLVDTLEKVINNQLEALKMPVLPFGVFEILAVFIVIELVSRILFSTSFPHFVSGITNYGNFATARIKAVIKFPLDLISIVCPIGELPVLIGKRSLKEMITLSQTRYRYSYLKFIAPLIIIFTTLLFCYANIMVELTNFKGISTSFAITDFKKKKATRFSHLNVSKGVLDRYYIDGGLDNKGYYIFAHKTDSNFLEYRGITSYSFKKLLKPLIDQAPFLEYTHPFLNQYLEDGNSNIKVRNDVLRILKSGELTNLFLVENLTDFDPLYAKESHKIFKRLNIPASTMSTVNEFYRLYKVKGEYYGVFVGEHNIHTFAITASGKEAEKVITQIHFSFAGNASLKTDYENGNSSFETNMAPLLSKSNPTQVVEKMMTRYKKFIQKNVP